MLFTGGAAQTELLPVSIAWLPVPRAMVWVGPPLLANGPSKGSVLTKSPPAVNPQVLPLSRLLPFEVIAPLQFPPSELFATIVLTSTIVPALLFKLPPLEAPLLKNVLLIK